MRTNWSSVVPSLFPSKEHWSNVGSSGVVAIGYTQCIAKSQFAAANSKMDAAAPLGPEINTTLQRLASISIDYYPLAFVDDLTSSVTVARDPLGQKEVYYLETRDFLYVTSSLQLLLGSANVSLEIDMFSASCYLLSGQPAPGATLANEIKKLPAGHTLEISRGRVAFRRRYFTPLTLHNKAVYSDFEKEHLVQELDRAVHRASSMDRNALLISGGIDSSYIASSLQYQLLSDRTRGYTVHFSEPFKGNETQYAKFASEHFGIDLKTVPFGPKDAYRCFEKVLGLAEPASAWASLTHLHLSEVMQDDGYCNFISGLGADEIFGGYSRFLAFYKKQRIGEEAWRKQSDLDYIESTLPSPTASEKVLFSGVPEFFSLRDFKRSSSLPFKEWSHYLHTASFYKECKELKKDSHFLELMTAHECQFRIPDLLFTSFETMTRNMGITGSYPFLDPPIVELGCALSASEKFYLKNNRWKNKKLLKEIASNRLPDEIINRPIGSYTTPINIWLTEPQFSTRYRELLMESNFWEVGLVSREKRAQIDRVLFAKSREVTSKTVDKATYQSWVLVTLSSWWETWISGKSDVNEDKISV